MEGIGFKDGGHDTMNLFAKIALKWNSHVTLARFVCPIP
jgi:hypothetical protein